MAESSNQLLLAHKISLIKLEPGIEGIGPEQINEAFERLEEGDVKYRFVVDLVTLAYALHVQKLNWTEAGSLEPVRVKVSD